MKALRPDRRGRWGSRVGRMLWLGVGTILIMSVGTVCDGGEEWLSQRVMNAAWLEPLEPQRALGRTPPPTTSFDDRAGYGERDIPLPATTLASVRRQPAPQSESIIRPDTPGSPRDDAGPRPLPEWLESVKVGYDSGFVIAGSGDMNLDVSESPFLLRVNAYGQLRHTRFDSAGPADDLNQFQLIRGRVIFAGSAFSPDIRYYVQMDGRSSRGDELRLLDYYLDFDVGRRYLDWDRDVFVFKAGQWKVPFTLSRYLSAREFEFSDRSMASMYFDVNRSLAWGVASRTQPGGIPVHLEAAVFNGLVTGGAETGSAGKLDDNFAYAARLYAFPIGEWGTGALADFDWHETLATRMGAAYAGTRNDRRGPVEFDSIRVVDSGQRLSSLLPPAVSQYDVDLFCVDASHKYRGWSVTTEYYFRNISGFRGDTVPDLFDHGFWLQVGKFVVPEKMQLLARWSRVVGKSGTLGVESQSSDERAVGFVWYFRRRYARITCDATYLDGAPISSSALDIFPGDKGWLFRTQIQFGF
jgi:hypothetical protein